MRRCHRIGRAMAAACTCLLALLLLAANSAVGADHGDAKPVPAGNPGVAAQAPLPPAQGPQAPAPAPAQALANAPNAPGDDKAGDEPAPPPPVMQALPAGWSAAPGNVDTVIPGREAPCTAAHEGVIRVAWNNYHTLIVVGPGHGVLRPGFVLTYQEGGDLQVAYRAAIFRDRRGVLHADARGAMMVGQSAPSWSPDSFAVFASGLVVTLDDHGSSERGMVTRTIAQGESEYLAMLLLAESVVDDGI